MKKTHTLLAVPVFALMLGAAWAQPTVSGNVAGGDKQAADTTRPDVGAPDAAGQAKVWHDQDTRNRNGALNDRKAERKADRDRRAAMAASPLYNSTSTPSTDTSAAPGAPGNAGAPNSKSSAGATGGGKP